MLAHTHTRFLVLQIASLLGPVEGLKIIRNALEYHEVHLRTYHNIIMLQLCYHPCMYASVMFSTAQLGDCAEL